MRKSFNAATEELVRIDIETHPIFKRLFGAEGFTLMTEEALADFLDASGLKMAVFADAPALTHGYDSLHRHPSSDGHGDLVLKGLGIIPLQ